MNHSDIPFDHIRQPATLERTRHELRVALDELSIIHENAPVAMLLVDEQRRIIKANRAAALFAGRSDPKEMHMLRGGEALGCLHHLDTPEGCGRGPSCGSCPVRNSVLKTFSDRDNFHNLEAWLPFERHGEEQPICLLFSTTYVELDTLPAVLLSAVDITDRKKTERELERYRTDLENLVRERTCELIRQRDTTQKYLDIVGVIILVLDMDGNVGLLNRKGYEVLGYADHSLIGKNWFDICLPDTERESVREVFRRMVEGEQLVEYHENSIINKSGEKHILSWHNVLLGDDAGNITGVLSSGSDITEQRQVEAALAESERRFRTVADYTYDWEYWRLPDDTIAYVSPSAERITSYSPEEFIADNMLNERIIHPEDRKTYHDHFLRKGNYDVEELRFRIVRKDGTIRWIHHICHGMRTGDGTFLGLRASNRDITEQVTAQRENEESREMFRQLADNIREMFFLMNVSDGSIVYISKAKEIILGSGEGEESSLTADDLIALILEEDRKRLGIGGVQWLLDDNLIDTECRIETRSGEIKWIRIRTFPVRDGDGKTFRIAGIITDITGHKNAAMKERLHREQLQQADKMASLGILVSGVAHEINNPNNFIMLNSPLLRQVWNDASGILKAYFETNGDFKLGGVPYSRIVNKVPQLFDGIDNGTNRIKRIVDDLKNYARKGTDALDTPVEVNVVVQEAVSLLKNMVLKKTTRFSFTPSPHRVTVLGNSQKLEQVVINLVQNACEALENFDQALTVSVTADENACLIEVHDEGKGIPEKDLSRLTDPFFTTRRESGGTGLGLSVSDGIVREHGGKMEFFSEPGKGTLVRIRLPLIKKMER